MAGPKLSVLIGGDDRELSAALKRAESRMGAFQKDLMTGVAGAVKFGWAVVAAGAAMAVHFTAKALEAIDAQAKLAQQLRTTQESVATLSRAGELAGVEFGVITGAAQALDVRLGQAVQSGGAAADSLKRLHLSAAELQALPLDERISKINQAIREQIPASEQAAVAADFFGKSAGQAIMSLDPNTLAEAAKQSKLFGTAISAIDAAKVEAANDSIS